MVVMTAGSLDGRGDLGRAAASRASGKEKRSTGSTTPPPCPPRAPGCRLQAWEVQALPGGFCLQGCGLCAVGGRPPSGRGDVAGSLDTAVSLQLPSSCWQPPHSRLTRGPRRPGVRPTWTRAAPASLETVHTRGLSAVIGPAGAKEVPEQDRASDTWKLLTHVQRGRSVLGGGGWEGTGPGKVDAGACGTGGEVGTPLPACPSCAGLQAVVGLGGWSPDVPFLMVSLGLWIPFVLGDQGQAISREKKCTPASPRNGQDPKEIAFIPATLSLSPRKPTLGGRRDIVDIFLA